MNKEINNDALKLLLLNAVSSGSLSHNVYTFSNLDNTPLFTKVGEARTLRCGDDVIIRFTAHEKIQGDIYICQKLPLNQECP